MSMDDSDGQMIFGDLGDLKLPDICLTGEEKPRKSLTKETCPDRGSNPGPLRDKRACYHLLHSGGQLLKILLLAVNLFSFSNLVSSDSSFNIHNALYFVKYPSRATQNSPEGRGLKTPELMSQTCFCNRVLVCFVCFNSRVTIIRK